MATLDGKNEIVITKDIRAGIRVEGYLNLCEHETEEAGKPVYHAVIELTDTRGGLEVPVQLLPIVNDDENSHKGHFELTEAARAEVLAQVEKVVANIERPDTNEDATDAEVVRAMWSTAIEMQLHQRQSQMGGLMEMLSQLMGDDDDFEDDDDDNEPSVFGSNLNPFSNLLS